MSIVVKCDQCKTAEAPITHEGMLPHGWTNRYQHLCPTCSTGTVAKVTKLTAEIQRYKEAAEISNRHAVTAIGQRDECIAIQTALEAKFAGLHGEFEAKKAQIQLLMGDVDRLVGARDAAQEELTKARAGMDRERRQFVQDMQTKQNVLGESHHVRNELQAQLTQKTDIINSNTETIRMQAKSIKELTDERTEMLGRMQSMAKSQVSMENVIAAACIVLAILQMVMACL